MLSEHTSCGIACPTSITQGLFYTIVVNLGLLSTRPSCLTCSWEICYNYIGAVARVSSTVQEKRFHEINEIHNAIILQNVDPM